MNESAINTVIVAWLQLVYPAKKIIKADQVGVKPISSPFVTYRIDSVVQNGHDEITQPVGSSGIGIIAGQRTATISVHFFGDNPLEGISKAYLSLAKPSVQAAFYAANIAILTRLTIQNISAMLETKYEPHAMFDFYAGLNDSDVDDLGFIERIGLTEHFELSQGTLTIGPFDIGV